MHLDNLLSKYKELFTILKNIVEKNKNNITQRFRIKPSWEGGREGGKGLLKW